jgi:hypothetical protein
MVNTNQKLSVSFETCLATYAWYRNKYELSTILFCLLLCDLYFIITSNTKTKLCVSLIQICGLYVIFQVIVAPNWVIFIIEVVLLSTSIMLTGPYNKKIKYISSEIYSDISMAITIILIIEFHPQFILN